MNANDSYLFRKIHWVKLLCSFVVLLVAAAMVQMTETSQAMRYTTDKSKVKTLHYDIKENKLYLNEEAVNLDSNPVYIDSQLYVPLKFLTDFFGLALNYDAATNNVLVAKKDFQLFLNMKSKQFQLNGEALENEKVALLMDGRIFIQLSWLSKQLSEQLVVKYEEQQENAQIVVTYMEPDDIDAAAAMNAKPIAKFVIDKEQYAMGEKITYTNLSYDPDGDAVALTWEGKQDAFFTPGEHIVSLVAVDQYGNRSEPYSKAIYITEQAVTSEFEFHIKHELAGEYFAASDALFNAAIFEFPEIKKKRRNGENRTLLVSDSPETVTQSGILYQDTLDGPARLYANHLNGSTQVLSLYILATNTTSKSIKLTTSRQGESAPSKLAMLVGSETTIDFLIDDGKQLDEPNEANAVSIAPGESIIYRQFPALPPQYSINAMYDVESTGELLITFVALTDEQFSYTESQVLLQAESVTSIPLDAELATKLLQLPKLPYNGHVRGSFPQASIKLDVYPRKRDKHTVQRLVLGDGVSDPFIEGYDAQQQRPATLYGNYGVVYDIHIHKPRRMAILLMARGGAYKGAVKVNGQFVRVPGSGILEPMKGIVSLGKTEGTEKMVHLQFIAPAGSSLPIMLFFYPLNE